MLNARLSILALAMLSAATTSALATEASYTCEGGTELTAMFSPVGATPGDVTLTIAGTASTIVLPQAVSADGGRYADANTEFWSVGNGATLTRSGKSETCEAKPAGTAG